MQSLHISKSISAKILSYRYLKGKLNLIQIGAGSGSLDPGGKDGFREFIYSIVRTSSLDFDDSEQTFPKALLLEPNPANYAKLVKSWGFYPHNSIKIYSAGYAGARHARKLKFYYHPDDKPCYQTCSLDINHVLKHYPHSAQEDIKFFEAECLTWEQIFGDSIFRAKSKYLLALDIEGIDFEALQDLLESSNICKVDCISYEAVHMTSKESKSLLDRAYSLGLKRGGVGFDKNGFDRILLRERSFIEAILAKMSGLFASGHGWLLEIENHRILNLNR